jgi:hypothetical protein
MPSIRCRLSHIEDVEHEGQVISIEDIIDGPSGRHGRSSPVRLKKWRCLVCQPSRNALLMIGTNSEAWSPGAGGETDAFGRS